MHPNARRLHYLDILYNQGFAALSGMHQSKVPMCRQRVLQILPHQTFALHRDTF